MANQRRRRPLQDEGRKDKQDFRQRSEQSRVQRTRIEEQRDRRERRREIRRGRRQQVDSVRSPKEDLRTDRFESRLLPVEDSFLARPVGQPHELPVVIGERWRLSTDQTFATGTEETVAWDTEVWTTERNGYPRLYVASTNSFRIPSGLSGIWLVVVQLGWSLTSSAGQRITLVEYLDDTAFNRTAIDGETSTCVSVTYQMFNEGDEFRVTGNQDSGGNLDLLSNNERTFITLTFAGK